MKDIQIVWLDPKDLVPYGNNSKLHPPEQIEKIRQQIMSFGFDVPIVILPNKVIIKGHGRREAALLEGMDKVPCIIKNMTEEHAKLERIADNKVSESPWDMAKLRLDVEEMLATMPNLEVSKLSGFSVEELDQLLPDFQPGSLDEQGRLDEKKATETHLITVTCPHCGESFERGTPNTQN